MNHKDISDFRVNYSKFELSEGNSPDNPYELFDVWFNAAITANIKEPNAMVLSTVSNNQPHARVVLLKGVNSDGFEFFTNYNSDKGQQLAKNARVALTFFYDTLERQIRIEGIAEKLSSELSDQYFYSRPHGSQVGAWVSQQSSKIDSRAILDEQQKHFEEKFKTEGNVPRPPHWGGYLVKPQKIEFWQGRASRLHDRLLYESVNNIWQISRLSP